MFKQEFITRMTADLGTEAADLISTLSLANPAVSIRENPLKACALPAGEAVSWCQAGRYLDERPIFTLDPLLHAGGYYVQEASSMIVGEIVRKIGGRRVLDLCAAPGGKTTHLSAVVNSGGVDGFVVANEVIRARAAILAENVTKWGLGNVVAMSSDAKNFGTLGGYFDTMVVDAPCSGEGMFRKDLRARDEWSTANVDLCAARARRIVSDAWNALEEGGTLIFSTCTFNRTENEETVKWICERLGAEVVPVEWAEIGAAAVVDYGFGGHFFPHKSRGEGFFCAVLRKITTCEYTSAKTRKLERVPKADMPELNRWLSGDLGMEFRLGGGSVWGYQGTLASVVEDMLGIGGVLYSGVEMGTMIRGELKPGAGLALSVGVSCVRTELGLEEALRYLRRDTLVASEYAEGVSLVSYGGLGLGWAKRMGARVNNNFPQNWRIRMGG